MKKRVTVALALLLFTTVGTAFYFLSQISTGELLGYSADDTVERPLVQSFLFFYLKKIRGLSGYENQQEPPLNWSLSFCDPQSSQLKCHDTLNWLIEHGEDPHKTDKLYGFTALHKAVVLCLPDQVALLLRSGADPQRPAGPGEFQGIKPLELVSEIKNCSSKNEIRQLLEAKL